MSNSHLFAPQPFTAAACRLGNRQTRRHQITCNSSKRTAKDPKQYADIEELRRELEYSKGEAPFSITKSIQWLSDAANNSADIGGKGARILAFQAYKYVLGLTPPAWRPPQELSSQILAEIEASTDPVFLQQLESIMLASKISTLKLLKRYPPLKDMDLSHDLMMRLVAMKGLFPGSDVARMIELLPTAFLGSSWPETEAILERSSKLLRDKLKGADVDFMFQEDPTLLFEDYESLEVGLRRLFELWDVDEKTLANSEPLELALAVKALGLNGPPKDI